MADSTRIVYYRLCLGYAASVQIPYLSDGYSANLDRARHAVLFAVAAPKLDVAKKAKERQHLATRLGDEDKQQLCRQKLVGEV